LPKFAETNETAQLPPEDGLLDLLLVVAPGAFVLRHRARLDA